MAPITPPPPPENKEEILEKPAAGEELFSVRFAMRAKDKKEKLEEPIKDAKNQFQKKNT